MYKKGAGNDKQGKDAGNRTLCPYKNFSQAISTHILLVLAQAVTDRNLKLGRVVKKALKVGKVNYFSQFLCLTLIFGGGGGGRDRKRPCSVKVWCTKVARVLRIVIQAGANFTVRSGN